MKPRFVLADEAFEVYDIPIEGYEDCFLYVSDPDKGDMATGYLFRRNPGRPLDPYCIDIHGVVTERLRGLPLHEPEIKRNGQIPAVCDIAGAMDAYVLGNQRARELVGLPRNGVPEPKRRTRRRSKSIRF